MNTLPLAIFGLGATELIIVFLVIMLLFGGAKLPGLAKGLGQSIKEFKKAAKEEDSTDSKSPSAPAASSDEKFNRTDEKFRKN